jgi:hypothetical protein
VSWPIVTWNAVVMAFTLVVFMLSDSPWSFLLLVLLYL